MSEKKQRPRACQTCHAIKIKCSLGSGDSSGPCDRCQRLGKECIVTAPRRQKDRVAELEAQVEALTRLLQTQSIRPATSRTTSSESGDSTPSESAGRSRSGTVFSTPLPSHQQKKRRRDDACTPLPSDFEAGNDREHLLEIDSVLPRDVQESLLTRYVRDLVPYFPAVPISGDQSYEALRKARPLLLQSAIYCASFGALDLERQEDVGKVVMDLLIVKAKLPGKKSAELIQAMQAAVLYYRTTKHHTHLAAWQFIEMAGGLAEDIGIGGPQRPPSLAVPAGGPYVDSSEAWRTWLVCHMLSATLSLFMRKPNMSTWDARDSNNLEMLEYSYFRMDSDELLGQHVRAEHLCDMIAAQQNLLDSGAPVVDVADPAVQAGMHKLMDSITDWKAQVPPALSGSTMDFWEQIAMLYLHEPVLHTATNKMSFSAPFIAPRLSVTDFPNPLVSQEHLASIYNIRDCTHAAVDLFENFGTPFLIAMPAMYFPGRVVYAMYLLAKLYVAVTAPGNTFGAFVHPDSLQLDRYLDKMVAAHARTAEIDEFCGQARILSASFKMREWHHSYRMNLPHLTAKARQLPSDLTVSSGYGSLPAVSAEAPNHWSNMAFVDSTHDLGLEEIFAEPYLTEWYPQQFDQPVVTTGLNSGFL